MDITSYLLGKKSGGGGGGSSYNAKIDVTQTYSTSYGLPSLITSIDMIDTSNFTDLQKFFLATKITTIPLIDTSSSKDTSSMFSRCINLISIPAIDTKNVLSMYQMFFHCDNLVTIPVLDTSKVMEMQDMFKYDVSLSNESLNNILKMCINAKKYFGTKTLYYLGLRSTDYSQERIEALPDYQNFINAGWTTGF